MLLKLLLLKFIAFIFISEDSGFIMKKIPDIFFFKLPSKIPLARKRQGTLLILTTIIIFTLFLVTLFPIITNNLSEPTSHASEEDLIKGNNFNNTQSIFQTYPDGPSSRSNRGVLDTWGMSEPTLENPDQPYDQTVYAGYKPYIFRFTIYPLSLFNNVSSVTIEIEDELLNHSWQRMRTRGSDRNTKVTSSFQKISSDLAFLDFNVTFGWDKIYHTTLHRFNIIIIDNNSNVTKTSVWLDYTVVKAVKFIGELKVQAKYQGELKDSAWVRSEEDITWTGLKAVYNSSANINLPYAQGKIIVADDDGDTWVDESDELEDMIIFSTTDPKNDLEDIHIISLTGPAEDNLISPINFVIRVDGDGVRFYNQYPKTNIWQNSTYLECGIIINDNQTSGVNTDTVGYSISIDNGEQWSTWYKPKIRLLDEHKVVKCYENINFQEGELNLLKWQCQDMVGNLFSSSSMFNIKIDTTPPTFSKPRPLTEELQYLTTVNCSIEISDLTSLVNSSSIQYSILKNGEQNWTEWKNINLNNLENKKLIIANVTVKFNYGADNYIKWRVKDIAGNGYVNSDEFQIRITHDTPKIYLLTPGPNEIINTTKPTLLWNDSYVMLQEVSYTLEYWPEYDVANKTQEILSVPSYTFEKPLKFDTKYYWQVTPKAGKKTGISESGIWNFTIDSISNIYPTFGIDVLVIPDENFKIEPDSKTTIKIIIYNKGNRDDTYNLNFINDPIWDGNIFYNKNISVAVNSSETLMVTIKVPKNGWEYRNYAFKLRITSRDAELFNQNASKTIELNVRISEEEVGTIFSDNLTMGLLIVLIIVIILVIISLVIQRKTKKKKMKFEPGPPARQDEVEIVFKPEHSKAIDRSSKDDLSYRLKK